VGAGASHGAGDVTPEPPPLGKGLYVWLRDRFPATWGAVAGELDALFKKEFELGMHDAWTNASGQVQGLLIDMGRAFARFRPPGDGSDHYTRLLRGMITNRLLGRCVIASLNYDCIFEVAAANLGVAAVYERGTRPANSVLVLKPHGSCNLLPAIGNNEFHVRFEKVGAYYEGDVAAIELEQIEQLPGDAFPPAMSLYAPGKHTPVAATWVDRARQAWRGIAVSANAVAVIGVQPIWDDAHAWDPVIASRADIWYVGDVDSHRALEDRSGRRVMHLGRTFDEGIGPLGRLLRLLR
jgi:hypothetical protein